MTFLDCLAITETVARLAVHPPPVMAKIQLLPDHDCHLPEGWRKSVYYCRRCGSRKVSRRLALLPHYCCLWCSGPSGCLNARLMSSLSVYLSLFCSKAMSVLFLDNCVQWRILTTKQICALFNYILLKI